MRHGSIHLVRRAGLLAALATAFAYPAAVAASDGTEEMPAEARASIQELAELSGEEFELAYINRIIPHHEGATMMAEAVVDRAPHAEVREAAQKMIDDQQAEIELLTTHATDELGAEVDHDERMMMSESMMAALRSASPARAELMFLLMMREHHEQAIVMGELALEKAPSDTIQEQASMMVEMQRSEQEEFETWIEQWYGIDAPTPTGNPETAMALAMDVEIPDTSTESPADSSGNGPAMPLALLVAAAVGGGLFALRRLAATR